MIASERKKTGDRKKPSREHFIAELHNPGGASGEKQRIPAPEKPYPKQRDAGMRKTPRAGCVPRQLQPGQETSTPTE